MEEEKIKRKALVLSSSLDKSCYIQIKSKKKKTLFLPSEGSVVARTKGRARIAARDKNPLRKAVEKQEISLRLPMLGFISALMWPSRRSSSEAGPPLKEEGRDWKKCECGLFL